MASSHLAFWSSVLALSLMAAPLVLWYRLGVSCHLYLRFDRPYLTALASRVIVVLLMLCWIVPTGWVI